MKTEGSENKKKISIVTPCYNEEANVKIIYEALKKIFYNKKYKYELIFVNDGSKDDTLKNLKSIVKECKN